MSAATGEAADRQREAADGRYSVWVAASAGTGKTKVLTDRVLNLLLRGSPPARILCLTFTKAAAAEMAIRINARLAAWTRIDDGALAQELGLLIDETPDEALLDQARRLFARVLDTPGCMKILTIHAFCQSLLRRFPLEAGIAPHFEVMDERSAGELLAEAREAMLAAARSEADPSLTEALGTVTRYLPEEGFADLLGTLTLERARLLRVGLDGVRFPRYVQRLHAALGVPRGATVEAILAAACRDEAFDCDGLRDAAAALHASAAISDRHRGTGLAAWLADPAGRVEAFAAYASVFLTKEGGIRDRLVTKRAAAAAPHLPGVLLTEAHRIAEVLAARNACALLQASAAMARLAEALLGAYAARKALHAALDYDDLILKTRDLLARPGVASWVLFKLDGGLDHILVDEAQDTNPEQWEVVKALAEEFFSGRGARANLRTVFAVGDAKQSIYSFQRADPRAFLDVRAHFAARVTAAADPPADIRWRTVDLDISFRSTAAVLRAVDAVFARPEAAAGVAHDGAAIRHAPQRLGHGGLVELWPAATPDPAEDVAPWEPPVTQQRARRPEARLAEAIAAQIRQWLDGGERLEARGRRVRAGDIMVLVRRRGRFVAALVRALKDRQVPVAGVDRMRLAEQLVIEDLVALGRFLLLPEDDLILATLLKGPLFGIDEEMLFRIAHDRGERSLWTSLRRHAEHDLTLHRAAEELSALLARVDFVAPYELFAEILSARGGRRAALARLGPDAADPLDEFLALALAYERTHIPSLEGFLHWLQTGETEVKRDLDQRGRNEVRVLTVHGAKGLQAPIVFLPDTLQAPTQTPRLLWTRDGEGELPLWSPRRELDAPAAQAARQEAVRRRDEEYRRLLYVATTRAEDRLYICGWKTRRAPTEGCWYDLLAAGLAAIAAPCEVTPLAGADGWSGPGLRLAEAQTVPARADDAAALEVPIATPLPVWARDAAPPEPAPPKPLAPSRPSLAEPAARSPLGGGEARGAGFKRGLLIHRLLQTLPDLPAPARREAALRYLQRPVHGLAGAEQAAIAEEILAIFADPDFAPLFGPNSQAEVPVVGLIGDYALSGQIDRLLVGPREVLIVDYKTLRPPPADPAEIPPVYVRQLAAYRAAVATIYPQRTVRCALLWTDGPRLMTLPPELLDAAAPNGGGYLRGP
ncbi:MAG: double-strand break repair helicase AddA [Alphaproteobacteria bacterium]|nr:double-strand break repair helicase AddA [Alphaproteobacteria bacterium]